MKTISLDILKKAALPAAQSHAILKVLELEMNATRQAYATREDLKDAVATLRVEMKDLEGRLMRWTLTCILGQTAVLAGLGYFFLAHVPK